MSHDHTVAEQAAKLVRENLQVLLNNIIKLTTLMSLLDTKLPLGQGGTFLRGHVLISGSSAKAARFREITGKGFPRDGVDCRPLLAESEEDFRRQWREWTGKDYRPGDDHGPHTVIVFAGSGHAVFRLDPAEQDPKQVDLAKVAFMKEMAGDLRDAGSFEQLARDIEESLPEAKKYMAEHDSLRKPKLPPEAI